MAGAIDRANFLLNRPLKKTGLNSFAQILKLVSKRVSPHFYKELGISNVRVKLLKFIKSAGERRIRLKPGIFYYCDPLEFACAVEEIFIEGIYEQRLPSNPYILDCGANIGVSLLYFKLQFPDALVEAFEPDSKNYLLLEKNVSSLNLKNIVLHKEAVWRENTVLTFSSDGSMSSRINDGDQTGLTNTDQVKTTRLKDYLTRKVDFLKMDIEGAEYVVIKDIAEDLHQVQSMFIEYHGHFEQGNELIELLNIVKAAGFNFYIKEAAPLYPKPFTKHHVLPGSWDVQLNVFCTRK